MKHPLAFRTLALAAGVALALGFAPIGSAEEQGFGPFATDSSKTVIRNSAGECWNMVGGENSSADGCGGAVQQQAPAPVDGDDDGDGVPNSRDKCPNTRRGAKVDMHGCEIVESVVINLVNNDFDFDSAKLKPAMKRELDGFAGKVIASPGDEHLEIVGHTDNKGTDTYNQKLSERRAKAVAEYLASKGINPRNMRVSGRGESQPVADNNTEAGRAKNRRVEINTR